MRRPSLESIRVLRVAESDSSAGAASALEAADEPIAVETAGTASEALDRLAGVDCVVSAYDLPDGTGIELLDAVREERPGLPFVLTVEDGSEAVASTAISAGVTDYLAVDPETDVGERLAARVVEAVDGDLAGRSDRPPGPLFRELAETTNDVLWVYSGDWDEVLFVNSAYEDIWGQSVETLVEQPRAFLNAVHPDDRAKVKAAMAALTDGDPLELECRVNPEEDYRRWVWIQAEPIPDEDGDVRRIAGCSRDVTERKAYEHAIEDLHTAVRESIQARSPEQLAELVVATVCDVLDLPSNGVWLHDEEEDVLRPVAWSDHATEIVGDHPTFRQGEGLAWEVFESGEGRYYDDVSAASDCYNPDTPVRTELILPLGEHGVLIAGSTEAGAFSEVDLSLAQTVAAQTEAAFDRLKREQQLREERTFIDQALDSIDDAFYVVGTDGELRRWNDRVPDVTGYADEEIADMQAIDFFPADERERIADAIDETIGTGENVTQADVLTADGERIPYELTGSRLTDRDGDVIGLVGVGRDVTGRKEYARELKRQNERLEEFASIVSHDLRNPLQVAQGRLELVRSEVDHDQLEVIADSHRRIRQLIEDLLTIAREGESAVEIDTVDFAGVLRDCWRNVDTAEATLVCEGDHVVRADEVKLKQLLENLIRNAVEHGGDDVVVRVGCLGDGFYFADDGPGIPEDERESVFQRGYSVADEGTGIGLSIVEQVAALHDWDVDVAESADGGARFEIRGVEPAP